MPKSIKVTAPYKNRTLATEDLERLRLALTLLYINKGYLTSGAIIPDQDVQAGVVAVHIIEGHAHQHPRRRQSLVQVVVHP